MIRIQRQRYAITLLTPSPSLTTGSPTQDPRQKQKKVLTLGPTPFNLKPWVYCDNERKINPNPNLKQSHCHFCYAHDFQILSGSHTMNTSYGDTLLNYLVGHNPSSVRIFRRQPFLRSRQSALVAFKINDCPQKPT